MSLSPGTRLGPYEITGALGAGGMGEVYTATDTRLNRTVAIKTSRASFTERFGREAHAIASLNHPHICSLYDVGPDYLVMEYVEGRSLAGPLPVAQAIEYASQILEALDAAHRKGIIHRDLKPANILVTTAGIKLLDFGLAKAVGTAAAGMVTASVPLTGAGTILGTLQYMAPEQLEGKDADARSDIFAFGLVFYELLTGKRAFEAPSQASLIASILKEQPRSIRDLVPMSTPGLERVLLTCLEKDPDKRWQSARDVRHALDWMARETTPPADAAAPPRTLRRWKVIAAVCAATAALAIGAAVALRPAPPPDPEPMRFQISPPENGSFEIYVALSPNGQRLAFTAYDAEGIVRIWVRDLSTSTARPLPGTEGAQSLFWSPDSRFLAFGLRNQLKKVDASGGPPLTLCDVPSAVGSGAWNGDGTIIFGGRGSGPLTRVSEAGGVAVSVTIAESGFHTFPSFVGDDRHFVYYRSAPTPGVYIGSLDVKPEEQSTVALLPNLAAAAFVHTGAAAGGRLVFLREGTLLAQPFDSSRLALTGEAVPIAERVASVNQYGVFTASRTGVMAYRSGSPANRQLTWLDRQGKALGVTGEFGAHDQPALSPDATRLADRDVVGAGTAGDIWLLDLVRNVSTRFTFDRSPGGFPVWSPDGSRIAFRTGQDLYQKAASGAGEAEVVLKSNATKTPSSWSRDGRFLLYSEAGPRTGDDIWVLKLDGDRTPASVLRTEFNENQATFSPDMRWIAYTSTDSGRQEIYVRPFTPSGGAPAGTGGRWQVSRDGGNVARWRADGRELIFRALITGAPMAVDVESSPTFRAGIPKRLFATSTNPPWVPTPDAQRFLVAMPPQRDVQEPITLVLNWDSGLKR